MTVQTQHLVRQLTMLVVFLPVSIVTVTASMTSRMRSQLRRHSGLMLMVMDLAIMRKAWMLMIAHPFLENQMRIGMVVQTEMVTVGPIQTPLIPYPQLVQQMHSPTIPHSGGIVIVMDTAMNLTAAIRTNALTCQELRTVILEPISWGARAEMDAHMSTRPTLMATESTIQ